MESMVMSQKGKERIEVLGVGEAANEGEDEKVWQRGF